MSDSSSSSSGGISLSGMLFILFLALKLTDVIDWSWWWVTAPLWIPAILLVGIFGIVFAILCFTAKKNGKRKTYKTSKLW